MTNTKQTPILARLGVLVGRWEGTAIFNDQPIGKSATMFEWLEGGSYLLWREEAGPALPTTPTEWLNNSPLPTTEIIGLDDTSKTFYMLHADARGVYRVYQMSMNGGTWKIWRDAPGFYQRFKGTISKDKNTITAYWEKSSDRSKWERDFDLLYRRTGQT